MPLAGSDLSRIQPWQARGDSMAPHSVMAAHANVNDAPRSSSDLLLASLIGMGLVANQLCRKHRLLRANLFGA